MSFDFPSIRNIANTAQGSLIDTKDTKLKNIVSQASNVVSSTDLFSVGSTSSSNGSSTQSVVASTKTSSDLSTLGVNPIQNVLNHYRNTTYHFQLSLTDDNADITKADKIVIAESGATVINILSVEMNEVLAPNFRTKNINWSTFEIQLFEPMGANLYDKIAAASKLLKVNNIQKCRYNLRLYFIGENPSTGASTKIGDEWNWPILITDITTNMNQSGCSHALQCVLYDALAASDDYNVIPASLQLDGTTVGDVLNNLAQALNNISQSAYTDPMTTYVFKDVPYSSDSKSTVKSPFGHVIDYSDHSDSVSINPGKVSVAHGTTIDALISSIMGNSDTACKLINPGDKIDNSYVDPAQKKPNSIYLMINTSVTIGAYNDLFSDYEKTITYTLVPYDTIKLYGNLNDTNQITDTTYNKRKIKYAGEKKYINKLYDYIFTGDNTEVTNFNIQSNFSYYAVMDYAWGLNTNASIASGVTGSKNDDQSLTNQYALNIKDHDSLNQAKLQKKALQDSLTSTSNSISDIQNQLANTTDQATRAKLSQQLTDALTNQAITSSQYGIITSNISNSAQNKTEEAAKARKSLTQKLKTNGNISYIDDYSLDDVRNVKIDDFTPVSIKYDVMNQDSTVGHNIDSAPDNRRSMYTSMLEQLYEPDGSSLIQVDLTVRGDPYWLGASYLKNNYNQISTSSTSTDSTFSSQYNYHHDTIFLLRFGTPTSVKDTYSARNSYYTGFYVCVQVNHRFNMGEYTQVLTGVIVPGTQYDNII